MSTHEEYRAELAELLQAFAGNIRHLRSGSQEALSARANLHRTEVGMIEQAKREPRLSTLLILADALDVTLNDLVRGLPVPRQRKPAPLAARKGARTPLPASYPASPGSRRPRQDSNLRSLD